MRPVPTALALAIATAVPAFAGQSGSMMDLWSAPAVWPPADSGKPMIFTPPTAILPRPNNDCLPDMPCGIRLLGTVQRNGPVELQVPALRW